MIICFCPDTYRNSTQEFKLFNSLLSFATIWKMCAPWFDKNQPSIKNQHLHFSALLWIYCVRLVMKNGYFTRIKSNTDNYLLEMNQCNPKWNSIQGNFLVKCLMKLHWCSSFWVVTCQCYNYRYFKIMHGLSHMTKITSENT